MSRESDRFECNQSEPAPFDLQEVFRQLESWQAHPPEVRQRRFQRFAARGVAWMLPGKAHGRTSTHPPVYIRDISRGGIGMLCSTLIEPNDHCQLQLASEQVVMATLPAFCRHCQQVTAGAYLVGMEFGVSASVLLSLGVGAKLLAEADDLGHRRSFEGDFVDPSSLVEGDAA
jgi:hypothetical protein